MPRRHPLLARFYTAAVVCAALALGVAGAAMLGGRWQVRLDVINHFAPFVLLAQAAVWSAAWLTVRPWRRVAQTAALAGALASAAMILPEAIRALSAPAPSAANGPALKIVQFNVWSRNRDPHATLRWILAQNADIVVLEEASGQSQFLIESLREAYPNIAVCGGLHQCQVFVLSRLAMVEQGGRADIPLAWGRYRWQGRVVTVVGAHFNRPYIGDSQDRQIHALQKAVNQLGEVDIVAGDLNAAPWSFALRRLDHTLGLVRRTLLMGTWPAYPPTRFNLPVPSAVMPIDHIFAARAWRTVRIERGPRVGSDHYPVVLTLAPR